MSDTDAPDAPDARDDRDDRDDADWIDELGRRAGAAIRTPAPAGTLDALKRRQARRRAVITAGTGAGIAVLIVGTVMVVGRGDADESPATPVATPVSTPAARPVTTTVAETTTSSPRSTGATGALATVSPPVSGPPAPVRPADRTFPLVPAEVDSSVVTPTAFEFTPDGSSIVATVTPGFVIVIDPETGRERRRFSDASDNFADFDRYPDVGSTLSTDGTRLFDGTVLWDVTTGEPVLELPPQLADLNRGGRHAFSPDSRRLAVATGCAAPDGCTTVYDAVAGASLHTIEDSGPPDGFTPDSSRLLTLKDGISVWDADTGEFERSLQLSGDPGGTHTFVGDGNQLLSTSGVALYDFTTGRRLATPALGQVSGLGNLVDDAGHVALSRLEPIPPGTDPVVVMRSGAVGVWDIGTGELITMMDASFPGTYGAVEFSPDGSLLLGAFEVAEGSPRFGVWSATTGQLLARLDGAHPQAQARFTPDGSRILAWGGLNEFWQWDVADL